MGTITVENVCRSTLVDGSVDADVRILGVRGEFRVTLIPREGDGTLDSWGSLDNWIGGLREADTGEIPSQILPDIVEAVREAADRACL